MLVPLTDSTNPYAAMMLELIRIQQAPRIRRERQRVRATVSRPTGARGLLHRLRLGRGRRALVETPGLRPAR